MLLYTDAIEHLIYNAQAGNNEKEVRDLRQATVNAYRQVCFEFDWQYYWTQYRQILEAPYATGTVVYDHTGGASERLLTLSGGTFPTNAKFYRLKIGNVVYPIYDRLSGTTAQLDEFVNPGADVSSTAYTVFRSEYALPSNFRRIADVYSESGGFETGFISPSEWLRMERVPVSGGTVIRWTILPDPKIPGQMQLVVDPYPSAATTLDFIYQRSARPIRLTGFESSSKAGTVSASAAGTAVTGSGTAFTASMVGSFIRIGDATYAPTGNGGDHPYVEQRQIVSYTSATSVSVYPAFTYTHSAAKYLVADPLDMWQGMFQAFLRAVEVELAISRKGAAALERGTALYNAAIAKARENDASIVAQRVAERGKERAVGEGYTVSLDD
jgi:hypothetical protein